MISDDNNKKTYLLTDLGSKVLDKEIERIELLLKDARKVIGGGFDES